MTRRSIPITKPDFDEADHAALAEPLSTGWVVQGPKVAEFERTFAEFCGAAHAVACTSCTTGLHLALVAAGVGQGDEVIVPAFTWVASANAVLYCGAEPVFCDVDLDTFNLNLEDLASRIGKRTKALMPVHLFGLPAEMDAVMSLACEHELAVIEDAACGLGARHRGRHVGTIGDFGAFSFHPRKAISTGEGGMVLTADAGDDERLRSLRDHGSKQSDLARHGGKEAYLLSSFELMGFNYRMTDIQGALGVSQMAKAPRILARRAELARRYDRLLADVEWLKTPKVPEHMVHGYQSYVCLFCPETPTLPRLDSLNERRNRLMAALAEAGVSTRQGTHAVHALALYRKRQGIEPADLPNSWIAERASLTLPLYPAMTEADQDFVVEQILTLGPG